VGSNKEYLTKEEAERFFQMIQSKDMEVVHLALDMILADNNIYLPYRYNDQGAHRLKEALDNAACDIRIVERTWLAHRPEYVPVERRSKALQKRLNHVRAKQTLAWDWRLIE
jgi:hypothetical protein